MTSRVSRRNTLNRRGVGLSLALGATTAMATFTGGALLADIALFVLCLATRRRPPAWVWLIALPIGVTSFWASTWWVPLWTAARVVGLGVVFAGWRPRINMVAAGYCTMLLAQTMGLLVVMEHYRPAGYTDNASVLGQAGLVAILIAPVAGMPVAAMALATGGITLGLSTARASLLSVAVFAVVRPGWIPIFIGVITAGFVVAASGASGQWDRYSVRGILVTLSDRGEHLGFTMTAATPRDELLDGRALEVARRRAGEGPKARVTVTDADMAEAERQTPYNAPRFTLWGYGYDSFVDRTGTQRPHTVPVIMAYEIGVLALPLLGVVAWALWTRRLPLTFALVMAPLWLFTEEQWSHPGGHYMLAVMVLAAVALKQQGHKTTADYVRAVGVWLHTAANRLNRKGQDAGEHQGDPHQRPAK